MNKVIVYFSSVLLAFSPNVLVGAGPVLGGPGISGGGISGTSSVVRLPMSTSPAVQSPQAFDINPPLLVGMLIINHADSCSRIVWATNEPADSTVWISTSSRISIKGAPVVSSTELSFSHVFELSGLTRNTLYYYVVSSTDAAGNAATSTPKWFICR